MVERSSVVVRQPGGSRAGEMSAHRVLSSSEATPEKILACLGERSGLAATGRRVVAAQDTTEINFPGRTRTRLGPAGRTGATPGFFIHATVAVDADDEAVLGLVDAAIWTRAGGWGAAVRRGPRLAAAGPARGPGGPAPAGRSRPRRRSRVTRQRGGLAASTPRPTGRGRPHPDGDLGRGGGALPTARSGTLALALVDDAAGRRSRDRSRGRAPVSAALADRTMLPHAQERRDATGRGPDRRTPPAVQLGDAGHERRRPHRPTG